jgi:hypothetical protein
VGFKNLVNKRNYKIVKTSIFYVNNPKFILGFKNLILGFKNLILGFKNFKIKKINKNQFII